MDPSHETLRTDSEYSDTSHLAFPVSGLGVLTRVLCELSGMSVNVSCHLSASVAKAIKVSVDVSYWSPT